MAFTKALYYPWIDIYDEGWLKNALLYWDSIQTIVPYSIYEPYSTETAREFYEVGILKPLHVKSSMEEINDLSDKINKYLETPEGAEVLMSKDILDYHYIHSEKLPDEVRELVEIHPEKLPYEIRDRLSCYNSKEWITVDSRFADFYMTILATHLSERFGLGLLTDKAANNKLANAVKLDAKLSLSSSRIPHYVAQGTLANLILEKINIDSDTPTQKILEFRRKHSDELGCFRTKIAEITTKAISNSQSNNSSEWLRQEINDIYTNEVKPAINNLKRSLNSFKINCITRGFLSVAFISLASNSGLLQLGLTVPQALFVGAGLSLIAYAINYNCEKADKLTQNPFSYCLKVENSFS